MKLQPSEDISARSVVLGLLLSPWMVRVLIELEVVRYTHPTLVHPLSNVVFVLFCLVFLNRILRGVGSRWVFRRGELLTIYVMQGVISALCTHDLLEILVTILPYPYRFATPENEWQALFFPYLPRWLTVSEPRAVAAFYEGQSSFFRREIFRAWIEPLFWWFTFVGALFFVLLCINVVLRKQWIEHERLTYPIIQLPLSMTHPTEGFFKKPLMWVGFSMSAGISVVNLLNSISPQVPMVPVKRMRIETLLGLEHLGAIQSAFYPFAIGISFLIPLDLLFSCWVFYWLYKAEIGIGSALGWNQLAGYPFGDQQGFGAYLAILGGALWTSREHLRRVWKTVWQKENNDSGEPMSYRVAVVGGTLATGYLFLFSWIAGFSVWVLPLFFGIYFALGTVIARMRAELGFLVHDLHNIEPQGVLIDALGTRRLGVQNLTLFALYNFFNRAYRAHPAPLQLEAFKLAERARLSGRRMGGVLLLTAGFGTLLTTFMLVQQYYIHGAATGYYGPWALGFGNDLFGQLDRWLSQPTETHLLKVTMMGMGALISLAMMAIRSRFLWWTLHPLGYAMSNSWGMYNLWCPLFVAWGCKFIILRQGGLSAYRKAIPFFLGLALGDYVPGYTWSLASILLDRPLYQFWP